MSRLTGSRHTSLLAPVLLASALTAPSAWNVLLHISNTSLFQLSDFGLPSQREIPYLYLSYFLHPLLLLYIFLALVTIWLILYFTYLFKDYISPTLPIFEVHVYFPGT